MTAEEKIRDVRQKIERLDEEILRLLNERARMVQEVGRVKAENNTDPYVPQREEQVLQRLRLKNTGPFPEHAIPAVFREIISACRSLEAELTVVYLGPSGTHTHLASVKHFGSSVRVLSKESLQEIFEAVEREKANFGVVPIENSTEGAVDRTLDLFIHSEVRVCGEVLLKVSHDLLSQTGQLEDIRTICSHPQALGQCQQWLRQHVAHVPLAETVSTAKAAERAREDRTVAAIATSLAAELYGLKVVAAQIEDHAQNYTRFLVLGPKICGRTGRDKTSVLFLISHVPGSLHRALEAFSRKGINLTKIESRPLKERPWEYVFFVDFEGHAEEPPVVEAMTELQKNTLFMKLLGSYPRSS